MFHTALELVWTSLLMGQLRKLRPKEGSDSLRFSRSHRGVFQGKDDAPAECLPLLSHVTIWWGVR